MTLHKLLETFDPLDLKSSDGAKPIMLEPAELEKLRTQTFEAGYASGWDDAKSEEEKLRQRVDAELERNIQNLAFSYTEAVDRIRGEVKAFVAILIERFFPEIVPDLVREHVRAELVRMADKLVEAPIEIVTAPDCADLLTDMLTSDFSIEFNLISDPNLAPRQVFVRIATQELEVDVSPLLATLREQFKSIQQPEIMKAGNDDR